jgi:hypothetical protein
MLILSRTLFGRPGTGHDGLAKKHVGDLPQPVIELSE